MAFFPNIDVACRLGLKPYWKQRWNCAADEPVAVQHPSPLAAWSTLRDIEGRAMQRTADRKEQLKEQKKRTSEMLNSPEPAAKKKPVLFLSAARGGPRKATPVGEKQKKLNLNLSYAEELQLVHAVSGLHLTLKEARHLEMVPWAHARAEAAMEPLKHFCKQLLKQWK